VGAGRQHARAGHAAALLPRDRVLVEGGVNAVAGTLVTAEIYDPAGTPGSPAGSMAAAPVRHTATLLNDGGVLVTGGSAAGYLNSTAIWDADTDGDGVPNRHGIAQGCPGIVLTGYVGPAAQMTKPFNPDSDGDGFLDAPSATFSKMNSDPNVDNGRPSRIPARPTLTRRTAR